ncbi:hypothetical protein B0H19DRAFT_1159110 [Mycena capillaripes]|nr:hypothetical protein B0H19DRAFT_1159110 [Mycena capillaripes]
MILSFLTAIVPVAVAALPGLSRHSPIVIDSTETCQFRIGSKQYDLCPIFGATAVQSPLLVKGGQAEYRFHFGLDSGTLGSSRDLSSQCPTGTRICLISAGQHTPIGSSIINVSSEDSDEFITLQFTGGVEGGAALQLVCDPQTEFAQPLFAGVENGVHSFIWRTKHGCETEALTSSFNAFKYGYGGEGESGKDGSSAPPSDDTSEPPEPEEDQELLDGDRQRKSRRSAAIILVVISITIISLSIISYKHPDRINFLLTEHVKPIFHHLSLPNFPRLSLPHSLKPAGEGRLVRWAQEDLELDEDFMVNGDDAFDEPDEAGDEYIPLRPSPRKGGRAVKNYGSATSPFW